MPKAAVKKDLIHGGNLQRNATIKLDIGPIPTSFERFWDASAMTTLSDLLDEDYLMDRAGDRYFQRGVYYFEEGRVHALAQYGDRITA